MTTLRENILADIVSSLAGTANVGSRIYRSRVVPLQRGESPALVVEAVSDKPDQVADPIVESLHGKIMADLTLGGYAIDVQPGPTTFEMIDADQPAGVIGVDYVVRYRTQLADLTQGP